MKTRALGRRHDLPVYDAALIGREQPSPEEVPHFLLLAPELVPLRLVSEIQELAEWIEAERPDTSRSEISCLLIAVLTLSVGGDFSLYHPDWDHEAPFPPINRRDLRGSWEQIKARLDFLANLAGFDVQQLREAAQKVSALTEAESKN